MSIGAVEREYTNLSLKLPSGASPACQILMFCVMLDRSLSEEERNRSGMTHT